MKKRLLTPNLLLASALVLTGCQAATLFGPLAPGEQQQPSTAQQGLGALFVGIRWPDSQGYRSQVIPWRTDEVVVSLVRVDDQGTEHPVLDSTGAEVQPVTLSRDNSYGVNAEFKLKSQRNIRITAKAYDIVNDQRTEIASAERMADVIPGDRTYIDLNLSLPTALAPRLEPLAETALKVGQPIPLTGANLGFDPQYEVRARLIAEGPVNLDAAWGTVPSSNYMPFEWTVKPTSNTALELVIPDKVDSYWDITRALSAYFRDTENRLKLYLCLVVDGVETNRLEVSLPRTGNLGAKVELLPGSDATASTGTHTNYSMNVRTAFEMPKTPGTTWVYETVSPQGGPGDTRTYKVVLNGETPYIEASMTYSGGSSPMGAGPFDSFHDSGMPGFVSLSGGGQLQLIGKEQKLVPGLEGTQEVHHYFAPTPQGGIDAWFIRGVGLVKMVEKAAYWTGQDVYTMSRTTVLKQFTPGAE